MSMSTRTSQVQEKMYSSTQLRKCNVLWPQRDHRSYAQVASQPCGSNFSQFPSVVNNEALHNTQVCDIFNSSNTARGADNIVPNALVSTLHVDKQLVSVGSDLDSVRLPISGGMDTHVSGRSTVKQMNGPTGVDLCDVPTTNRFSLWSQLDVCPDSEELGEHSNLVSTCSFLNPRSDNRVRKHNTDSDVQSEDMDAFASSLQLTSAGFDPLQSSSIHTSVSDFTHPLPVKSFSS